MTFFPADPDLPEHDEHERQQPPWWQAPEDALPGIIPQTAVIAASEHVALALVGVHVFAAGVEFRIERHLRRGPLAASEWRRLVNRFMEHMGEGSPADRLRHGLVLADGEQVLERRFGMPDVDPMTRPEGFSLMRNGGGGGGGSRSYTTSEQLWLWPLPPSGATQLIVQWPEMDILESRLTVDLSRVSELAATASPLWRDTEAP